MKDHYFVNKITNGTCYFFYLFFFLQISSEQSHTFLEIEEKIFFGADSYKYFLIFRFG